jgi:hypothetical protein
VLASGKNINIGYFIADKDIYKIVNHVCCTFDPDLSEIDIRDKFTDKIWFHLQERQELDEIMIVGHELIYEHKKYKKALEKIADAKVRTGDPGNHLQCLMNIAEEAIYK